jgi:catechol 2,3-dioxygenase-like lactoylglutathione lyase family enzyme
MITLDHTVLRVRDLEASIRFYQDVLGFKHEGRLDPLEIIRVHEGFTIDLVESDPTDPIHYAFCMGRQSFNEVYARLKRLNIPFGNGPHTRDNGQPPAKWAGAKGMADALYFDDPSGHIIEIRTYEADET